MLIVVSPAKSLDFDSKLPTKKHSEPRMLDDAAELVDVMSDKSPAELSKMMSVSEALGELNHERFQDWEQPFTPDNYKSLQVDSVCKKPFPAVFGLEPRAMEDTISNYLTR